MCFFSAVSLAVFSYMHTQGFSQVHTVFVASTFSVYNCVYLYIHTFRIYTIAAVFPRLCHTDLQVLLKVGVLTLKLSGVFKLSRLQTAGSDCCSGQLVQICSSSDRELITVVYGFSESANNSSHSLQLIL